MEFDYLDVIDKRGLINNLFVLKFSKDSIPFKTQVLPLGLPALIYVFNKQETEIKGCKNSLKGLHLFGQFYGAYNYNINEASLNLGVNFKPTSIYKILKNDISLLTNKHILLSKINTELSKKITPIFIQNKNNIKAFETGIINFINSLDIKQDKDVHFIDIAINHILEKEGLLKANDLLNIMPFSQKSLEVKFKKTIGLTPGKYIKMIRFNQLMKKYQNKKINLQDLLIMYNYYDQSHFTRDFKLFMSQSPKDFFKKDYPLLKKYLFE